jgi:hypothetical protein
MVKRVPVTLGVLFALTAAVLCFAKADSSGIPIPTSPIDSVSGCPRAGWPSRSLVQCFYKGAVLFKRHTTKWQGTQCPGQSSAYVGHCACAAAVSVIIMNATHYALNFINVDQFFALANRGTAGGGLLPKAAEASAKPGDIILWYTNDRSEEHVGFCAAPGCVTTWSNSSALGVFAPVSHSISLDNYYPQHRIWEPVHLP